MANREPVKNERGIILGWIDVESSGDKTYRAFSGRILGWYRVSDNTTRDFSGRIIGRGDIGISLIYMNLSNNNF